MQTSEGGDLTYKTNQCHAMQEQPTIRMLLVTSEVICGLKSVTNDIVVRV
jgi:hypothetical protein